MKEVSAHHRINRFFYSRLFLIVTAVLALFISFGVARAYYQDVKIRQEIRTLESDIEGLHRKKLESMELLAYVLSPDFVEEKARLELNMKKLGEHVAVVQRGEILEATTSEVGDTGQEVSNPLKWWYYFWQFE
jgi:cell division protein FtsB